MRFAALIIPLRVFSVMAALVRCSRWRAWTSKARPHTEKGARGKGHRCNGQPPTPARAEQEAPGTAGYQPHGHCFTDSCDESVKLEEQSHSGHHSGRFLPVPLQ